MEEVLPQRQSHHSRMINLGEAFVEEYGDVRRHLRYYSPEQESRNIVRLNGYGLPRRDLYKSKRKQALELEDEDESSLERLEFNA